MADNMNFYAKLWLRDDTGAGSRSARRNIRSIADQLRDLQRIGVAYFTARAFSAAGLSPHVQGNLSGKRAK